MKKKLLIFAHNDKAFLCEILSYMEGLDVDVHSEEKCIVKEKINYEWKPDIIILQATTLNNERCLQHIKSLSNGTIVLIAERNATIKRYIDMQMLGVEDYFSVPLSKEIIRSAVSNLQKTRD